MNVHTYKTTDQFIEEFKSFDDAKIKQLSEAWDAVQSAAWSVDWSAAWFEAWSAAWSAAQSVGSEDWSAAWFEAWFEDWSEARFADLSAAQSAARSADLAVLAKDKITAEQFEILTSPWTSCGLSLYAEDWEEVLNPPVTEPKNFGAIVEAEYADEPRTKWIRIRTVTGTAWQSAEDTATWRYLINPIIISEGVEG